MTAVKDWILQRWKILTGALIVLMVIGGWWYWRGLKAGEKELQLPTVPVTRGHLQVTVAATGKLEPLTTIEVKSRTGGEIMQMNVEAGDVVEKGDVIAQLDTEALKDRVDVAIAQVDSANANVERSRYTSRAQSAQTRTQVREARAGLQTARARLRTARAELDDTRESTQQNIIQAQARLDSANAQLQQAKTEEKAEPANVNAQIEQAEASLEQAQQQLAALKAGNRPEEIAQAKARLQEAEAVAENAKRKLERNQRLHEKGFVSGQTVDDARQSYQTAQAQVKSARQAYQMAKKGAREEEIQEARARVRQAEASLRAARTQKSQIDVRSRQRQAAEASVAEAKAALAAAKSNRQTQLQVRKNDVEAAEQAVDQAEATLQRAKAGTLTDSAQQQAVQAAAANKRQAEANLEDVRYDFEHTTVKSPRAGVVLEKLAEEGTVIPAGTAALAQGTAIITLADISEMYVMADVDEVDISKVKVGQPVDIEVETLPDVTLKAEVQKIFPEGQQQENVIYFPVRIRVLDSRPELRPGMTVDAEILTAERKDALLVPDSAIDRSGGETKVQVLPKSDAEPVERKVKVGITNWENTEIISGLKEGELVVLPSGAPAAQRQRGRGTSPGKTARRTGHMMRRRK